MITFFRNLDAFFPSHLLLQGQLAMVQFCVESLTPAENSLPFESFGNFPVNHFPPNLFPKFTTCGNTAQDNSTFSRDQSAFNRLASDQLR